MGQGRTIDNESRVIRAVQVALDSLPRPARDRVVRWAYDKYILPVGGTSAGEEEAAPEPKR